MRQISSGLFFLVSILFTGLVYGAIQGSVHDFSAQGWAGGEICLPCHTPHNADTTVTDSPLWNHQVTAAVFTLYSSPTLDITPEQPRGPTKLCLSCHDGTVALDSFGGNTGLNYLGGDANLGTDLFDDHPVSIRWEHQTELGGSMCSNCHILHPFGFNNILPFFDRHIECSTCHDVHNGTPYVKLLRKSLQGSDICFHCHGK